MRRVFGGLILLLGLAQSGWIVYNLYIQPLPETRGIDPLPASLLAAGMITVGVNWLRGKTAR
ncbi:MAG: hypothetical protein ACK47B_20585 [Armatimonadota bacterium]